LKEQTWELKRDILPMTATKTARSCDEAGLGIQPAITGSYFQCCHPHCNYSTKILVTLLYNIYELEIWDDRAEVH